MLFLFSFFSTFGSLRHAQHYTLYVRREKEKNLVDIEERERELRVTKIDTE